MKKRWLAMVMALCLCASLVPVGARADNPLYDTEKEVSTATELKSALPSAPNPNPVPVAKLAGDITVTSSDSFRTMGKIVVPDGMTLTIENGASVEAEVKVESGGKVLVKAGGTLATTMAGEHAIVNDGTITVNRGGVLRSQKGGNVVNNNGATLHVDGVFYCNGNYDATKTTDNEKYTPWFSNSGTVNGSGQVVVLKAFAGQDEAENDIFGDVSVSAKMTERVKTQFGSSPDIKVYTQAESIEDLVALNSNESPYNNVSGIFLSKDMTEAQAQAGNRNCFDVTNNLTITKNLWLDQKTDLYVGSDATLTVDKDKLLFSGRGNISVEPTGGTLQLDSMKLLGGNGTEAAFVPTSNRIFLSAMSPDAAGPDYYPAVPCWIYLQGNATAPAGTNITALNLHLIVDSVLELKGDFSADSAEVRGELTYPENATVSIGDVDYDAESKENALKGTKSTTYEMSFNLNTGNNYDDVYDHLNYEKDSKKIYLEQNFVPASPNRPGYRFDGWTATSPWAKATSEGLAKFTVQTDETGAYVPAPTDFPVLMTAQWTRAGSSNSNNNSNTTAQPTAETVTPTASDAAGGAVSLEATVKDETATVAVPAAEIDRVAQGETAGQGTSLVLDVSGLSKPVSAVTLDKDTLEKIADAAAAEDSALDGLTVKLTDCAVTLDAEALEAVADQAGGKTVTLAVDVNAENLTDFQKNVVAELDNAVVLDVYLVSDGKRISDFHDGKATLEIPYQWDGEGVLRAVFVRDDGSLEVVPVSWSDGVATVTVGHFSHYAIFTEEALPFMDVTDPLSYYYDAVKWALDQQITAGTTDTTFSPDAACTRAQMVTFLWRAAGTPEPVGTSNPFADVSPDAYYRKAVLWAAENGITAGTSEAAFSPDMTCTRAQMAAFLHRFAGTPASEGTMPFADVSPDAYYHDAVLWAANCGVTTGTSATTFSPNDPCSRGQIVTFLYRSA